VKVTRYFHIREYGSSTGGATAKVTGDTDILGQVDIQYTKCSNRDLYCRKTGRLEADKAPVKIIPLRYLPRELENITEITTQCGSGGMYDYAIKYFLPKE
jgi:hypothetical protein